ncbi:MAG: PorT family protein [Altibacter sp.]|uniref:porin family protein n=1 Tax=Altibacter lentus TaxID=1223410 RepID=UPI000A064AB6|nr:porin family protein [Altibacter lentus]MCW8980727.1 PorT family protein [Altibacter sp.]
MKLKFFFILFIVGSTMTAQEKFSYGFHGGITYAVLKTPGLSFDDYFSTSNGLLLGVHGNYNVSKHSSFVANLTFEQKGATTNFAEIIDPSTDMPFGNNGEIKLNYLVAPILYRHTIGGGKLKVFLNAGLFLGILVDSETNNHPVEEFDTTDFGFSGGLGFDYDFSEKKRIFIEFRSNIGSKSISALMNSNNTKLESGSNNIVLGFTFL